MTELVELLDKKGIAWKKTNNPQEILIKCTNPEHEDGSPSLSYNVDRNVFNCWSCGFRGGRVRFLESIGEATTLEFESKQEFKIARLHKKLQDKLINLDVVMPENCRPWTQEFRGISADTIKEFEAFITTDEKFAAYLCFPIRQYGRLHCIEGRLRMESPAKPKYLRRPHGVKVSEIMFPLDKVKNTNSVILVEGLFDMLNMWQMGYKNTLCIFGSTNFNKFKVKMLDNLGITKVYLMFDGDSSGRKAAEKIEEMLLAANIFVTIINVPEGRDPGDLRPNDVKRLFNE